MEAVAPSQRIRATCVSWTEIGVTEIIRNTELRYDLLFWLTFGTSIRSARSARGVSGQ
jgi:hypothetical protein